LYFLYCCLYSLVFLWAPKLWVLAVSGLIYMLGKQFPTMIFLGLKVYSKQLFLSPIHHLALTSLIDAGHRIF
jgi:hypothetical protein